MPNDTYSNSFYEAFNALEKFETGSTEGVLSSPFFFLNRIIALLDHATNQGDLIAPFFLEYLCKKYDTFVEVEALHPLDLVPSHRAKGDVWVKSYEIYLSLLELIKKETEIKPKNLKKILVNIDILSMKKAPIAPTLAAKCMEALNRQELSSIAKQYAESAFMPNHWAMNEYSMFLKRHPELQVEERHKKKLINDLSFLNNSSGNFYDLHKDYEKKGELNYSSQWLVQACIHAEADTHIFIDNYMDPAHKCFYPIDYSDALIEAKKSIDYLYTLNNLSLLENFWSYAYHISSQYESTIKEVRYPDKYASFMMDLIWQFMDYCSKNQGEIRERISTCEESNAFIAAAFYQYLIDNRFIFTTSLWELSKETIPKKYLNNLNMITEIALGLEKDAKYDKAELLYEKAYQLAQNNELVLYNLANILNKQNKQFPKQITLFLKAANLGCLDSIHNLFSIFLLSDYFSIDALEALKDTIEVNITDAIKIKINGIKEPINKNTALTFISLTIEEKKQEEKRVAMVKEIVEANPSAPPTQIEDIPSLALAESGKKTSSSPQKSNTSTPPAIRNEKCASLPTFFETPKVPFPLESACKSQAASIVPVSVFATPLTSTAKERAAKNLLALNDKDIRNLTYKDLLDTQRYAQILSDGSTILTISNKGRTSGSRVNIGGYNCHKPHAQGFSIGAQKQVGRRIESTLALHGLS